MEFQGEMVEKFKTARNVLVVTGSGISAESGVPTFRGEDGLWKRYRAEDLATPYAFDSDPKLVWEWYDWRRQIIGKALPNPAHVTLVEMEEHYPQFLLVTQNVDGLHRRAGSRNMVEIHGNIWRTRCMAEGNVSTLEENPLTKIPPLCSCGALLRPDVVWFGESLPIEGLARAEDACRECDILLVVGTSGYVYPVASFPRVAKSAGATVVEVNVENTPISNCSDYTLLGKASDVLPELWKVATE